jgi:SAM-dependent methyltransferase
MTRTYSTFGVAQALQQLRGALTDRGGVKRLPIVLERLRRDEARIAARLGHGLEGLDVLELGPGEQCLRSGYLGLRNRVTAIDLDRIAPRLDLATLADIARTSGWGRLAKTLGRRLLGVDARARAAWAGALGVPTLPQPRLVRGDLCAPLPFEPASFDLVVSWSVFEHLPDPAAALEHAKHVLRPGGVLFVGIHLYTSNTGHHDIRSFTRGGAALPPWAHLRPSTRELVRPSAVLNELRLREWRAIVKAVTPDAQEFLERYDRGRLQALLAGPLRAELADYDEDELLSVDVFYLWQKPADEGRARLRAA